MVASRRGGEDGRQVVERQRHRPGATAAIAVGGLVAGAVALGRRAVGGLVIDAEDAEGLVPGGVAVDPVADGRALAVAAAEEGRAA